MAWEFLRLVPTPYTASLIPPSPFLPSSPSVLVHRRRKTETSHRLESISLPPPATPPPIQHTLHTRENKNDGSQKKRAKSSFRRERGAVTRQTVVYTVYDSAKLTKLAATSRPELCLFCSFQPNKEAVAHLGKRAKQKKPQDWGGGRCLCVCIQFVHVVSNLLVLVVYVCRYVCTCVHMCLCDCTNLTACSHYQTFLQQTNSLKPNAEHSSALESASYVGGWNGYRDISGFDCSDGPYQWSSERPSLTHYHIDQRYRDLRPRQQSQRGLSRVGG